MPKRKGVFSGKSPPHVLEIYILMRLTWPNLHLLPVTYSFRHSIEHCDIKNVFIEAAEIKGCYFFTLYSPSRWGSVIGQRTIWLQQTPPSPPSFPFPLDVLSTWLLIANCTQNPKMHHLDQSRPSEFTNSIFSISISGLRPPPTSIHFGKSGSTHVIPARSNRRTQYNYCWKLLLCL